MINTKRAMKGCPWRYFWAETASTYSRISSDPYFRFYNRGFRCVYSVNSEPHTGTRVLRGGSWRNSNADDFRSRCRYWNAPDYRNNTRGFRCVYPVGNLPNEGSIAPVGDTND